MKVIFITSMFKTNNEYLFISSHCLQHIRPKFIVTFVFQYLVGNLTKFAFNFSIFIAKSTVLLRLKYVFSNDLR